MSVYATGWAKRQDIRNPTAKTVLVAIADYADENGYAWPSQERLARDTAYCARTIRRAIATLAKIGLISIEKQPPQPDGRRMTNLMRLVGFPEDTMSYGAGRSQRTHSPKPEDRVSPKPSGNLHPYSSHVETQVSTGRGYTRGQRRTANGGSH